MRLPGVWEVCGAETEFAWSLEEFEALRSQTCTLKVKKRKSRTARQSQSQQAIRQTAARSKNCSGVYIAISASKSEFAHLPHQ